MDYHLTQHARDALEKRRIRLEWMERVLTEPEQTEADAMDKDIEHRLAAITEFQGRVLRVIVNAKANPPRVITAYFDRRRRGR